MEKTIILGTDLMLFVDNVALGAATSCKLAISANALETSSKDNGKWTSKQASKLSWNCSSENLFIMEDYSKLVDTMIARTPVTIHFSTVSNADSDTGVPETGWAKADNGYYGQAIITSIDATANDGDNATYSVSLEGTGALQKNNK